MIVKARYYSRPQARLCEKDIELAPSKTVLLLRNLTTLGFDPALEVKHGNVMSTMNHIEKMRAVTEHVISPLLNQARKNGVQILFIRAKGSRFKANPQRSQTLKLLPENFPEGNNRGKNFEAEINYPGVYYPVHENKSVAKEMECDFFFEGYREALTSLQEDLDFPDCCRPEDGDWVVDCSTQQVQYLMNTHCKTDLLHAGFDMIDDVYYHDGGIYDNCRRYRGFLIRDAVSSPERHDATCENELNDFAIRVAEESRCYSTISREIRF